MREPKIDTWIKAGYKILSTEGLDGIKVERLARMLHLNKSGFYYYFGSMKAYVKHLLDYHVFLSKGVATEIGTCKCIDPDLLQLVIRHKPFFLVESQMLVKCNTCHDHEDFDHAGRIIVKELLPLWKKASELPEDSVAALPYLNILRHFFYARINSRNVNYEFLHRLVHETKEVLNRVMEEKHGFSQNMIGVSVKP